MLNRNWPENYGLGSSNIQLVNGSINKCFIKVKFSCKQTKHYEALCTPWHKISHKKCYTPFQLKEKQICHTASYLGKQQFHQLLTLSFNSIQFIYVQNLTAQRPITKLAQARKWEE
jgi:hypothetical protein